MPVANVRGVNINYEILGTHGPWLALSPGGRRALDGIKPMAQRMAGAGYRVFIHDRRNCGASDIAFDPTQAEFEVWAEDLHALLSRVDALPAVIGGSSSGGRLALLFTLRYPSAVSALLLWRVTGGRFAVERLAESYYGDYIALARQGGMAAVCASEHFAEVILRNPNNRQRLMAMTPESFIAVMERWRAQFLKNLDLPIIGASEVELNSIRVPTCIVPGNDRTHAHATAERAHRMIAGSELHDLFPGDCDVDLVPPEDWAVKEAELAAIFADFLRRAGVIAERAAESLG